QIAEAGYMYIWLSNENATPVEVYFDDFKVTHTKSPVVASDDYYPFGLAFNSYSRENTTPQDYKYNGKEEQTELGLGWLDYGARMYQPELGRFFTQDRFADKYLDLTPYHYGANNPIFFNDINGDSLIVSGEQSAIDKFIATSNAGLGGFYKTTVGENGLVSIEATDKEGTASDEQKAFYESLSGVTSLETGAVKVGLVEGSPEVIVGSYDLGQLDVDDIQAFGDGPVVSAAGTLIHEVTEQAAKQREGKGYNDAHADGVKHENSTNGSERVTIFGALPGSSTRNNGPSYNYQRNGTMSGNIDLEYKVQGRSTTVSIRVHNNDVKNVTLLCHD
ncbi:MAG: RHS repeat-associated core domain-containing protein, partial [Flammeovirgaceae bacterium]